MAYNFIRANSSVISGNTPITDYPFTISCWFRTSLTNTNQTLVAINDTGNISTCSLLLRPTALLSVSTRAASSTVFANSTATHSTNIWHHACGVWSSSTSRSVYLDGGNSGTNTATRALSGAESINIGNTTLLTNLSLQGNICEVGIWNTSLSSSDILSLANAASPKLVSSKDLIFYAPLVNNIYDYLGSTSISGVNSPTPTSHARIYI